MEVDKVDGFKEEFEVFLNQNITPEVGYLTKFSINVIKNQQLKFSTSTNFSILFFLVGSSLSLL